MYDNSSQTVGCVVRVLREEMAVLNMFGKVVKAKPQGVSKKRDSRNAVALDGDGVNIISLTTRYIYHLY